MSFYFLNDLQMDRAFQIINNSVDNIDKRSWWKIISVIER